MGKYVHRWLIGLGRALVLGVESLGHGNGIGVRRRGPGDQLLLWAEPNGTTKSFVPGT